MRGVLCLVLGLLCVPATTWARPSHGRHRAKQRPRKPTQKVAPASKLRTYTAPAPLLTVSEKPPPPPIKPAAAPAPADQPAKPDLSPTEQRALEKALSSDAAAESRPRPMPTISSVLAPVAANNPTVKGVLSLNPDVSAIVDIAGGYYSTPTYTNGLTFPVVKSGDDPAHTGFNLQEVELAVQATVDPYFRADIFLTVPNLQGLEVEEAFVTTTSLPASLQVRAGVFRAPFGRQNTQHLHLQDFTRRPTMNALFLGLDGLRAPGAELSWLVPLPFYLLVTGAAFSVSQSDVPFETSGVRISSFGGGKPWDFTYLGNIRSFAQITGNISALFGVSFATGIISANDPPPGGLGTLPLRSYVYGADLYVKWKPDNQAQTYLSLAWQSELYLRHIPDGSDSISLRRLVEGALYSQLVLQIARRWYLGVRGEIDGIPPDSIVPRQYAGALSATWALSEFARLRAYGEARNYTPWSNNFPLEGKPQGWSFAAFLQVEAAIGAHGAHPY